MAHQTATDPNIWQKFIKHWQEWHVTHTNTHPRTHPHVHTITHLPAQPAEVTGTVNIYPCLLTSVKMTSTTAINLCLLLTPLKWLVQLPSTRVCYWHLSNDQYNWHLPVSATDTSQMTSTTDIYPCLLLTPLKWLVQLTSTCLCHQHLPNAVSPVPEVGWSYHWCSWTDQPPASCFSLCTLASLCLQKHHSKSCELCQHLVSVWHTSVSFYN